MGIVSKKRITDALAYNPTYVYFIHDKSTPYILELKRIDSCEVNRTWLYAFHQGVWEN